MADRVELAFRDAARRRIPTGSRVLVAVSGGADSVALLALLHRVRTPWRLELHVAHLDHGLRRASVADRRFVERLAARLELPCVSARRDVGRSRRKDESPEEAARRVRRTFLLDSARHCRAGVICTGHTLDDQAETVLMRLARGAGATALTGMAEAGPGPFLKPLLGLERAQLRAYLERRGESFREDASNRSLRFDRNRVRRLIVPLIAETLNPRAARQIVRSAARLREDAVFLDELAAETLGRIARGRGSRLTLGAAGLADLHPVVARRVARLALSRAGCDPRRLAADHVKGLLDLARGAPGRETHLPGRLRARRTPSRIVFEDRT